MNAIDMKEYARRGAAARITELNEEREAIYGAFPDLRDGRPARRGRPAKVVVNHEEQVTATIAAPRRRNRPPMTDAQRKAVGERMKKYWAARRAQATKKR